MPTLLLTCSCTFGLSLHSEILKFVVSLWQVEVISKSQAMLGPTAKLQTLGRTVIGPSPGVPAAAPPQALVRIPSGLPAEDRDRPLELQEVVSEEEEGASREKPPAEKGPEGKLPLRADSASRGRGDAAAPKPGAEESVAGQVGAPQGPLRRETSAGRARYATPPAGLPKTPPVRVGDRYVLPPGWKQLAGDTGEPYFYNMATRQTQWDPPVVSRSLPLPGVASTGRAAMGEDDGESTPRM